MINPETYTAAITTGPAGRTAGQMPVFGEKRAASARAEAAADGPAKSAAPEGMSFLDFMKGLIDVVNPLQHIPVVSTLYRHLTGDEISPAARIAGDALFGGPVGAAMGVADAALAYNTGKDMGDTAFAMLTGDKTDAPATMLASATPEKTDIVWNTPDPQLAQLAQNQSRLPPLTAPARASDTETALDKPAQYAPVLPPVSALKGDVPAFTALNREESRERPTTADSTVAFLQQNAPDGDGQKSSPPGRPAGPLPTSMIPAKMMEALDKYEAMNRSGLAPARPAVYGAF